MREYGINNIGSFGEVREIDAYYQNVVLLLNAPYDAGVTNIQPQIGPVLIRGGNAISSSFAGVPSILFDGTGDQLNTGGVTSLVTTEDFCIEAEVVQFSRSTDTWGKIIYSQYDYGTESTNRTLFSIYDDGTLRFQRGAFILSSPEAVPLGAKVHVAVTRVGAIIRLLVNGTVAAESNAFSGTLSPVQSIVGALYYSGYIASFDGHIHYLRVTKGTPRYVSQFIPHPYPLPTVGF